MLRKIFLLTIVLSVASLAQGQSIESKKCRSCGKLLKECPYKGKHPQQQQTTQAPAPKPKEGSVYVTSTPSGAVVKLDGTYKGETPLTIEELSVGNHTVTFNKEGFESVTKTVSVIVGKKAECIATLKKKASQQTNTGTSSSTTSTQKKVHMDGNTLRFEVDGTEYSYRMVYVSGGTYQMGAQKTSASSPNYDPGAWDSEGPVHSVTVGSFYMGETEVTQALWKAVMGGNPSKRKGNDLPVESVSYNDVQEFIRKLNNMTGSNFRLPTEEEWEYAARGGSNSRGYKYSGSGDDIGSVAWYSGNSDNRTHPVRQKRANELGLYDMSGNVWEWCSSLWSVYNSGRLDSNRVSRGGSWIDIARFSRVSSRGLDDPSYRSFSIGFRLAR